MSTFRAVRAHNSASPLETLCFASLSLSLSHTRREVTTDESVSSHCSLAARDASPFPLEDAARRRSARRRLDCRARAERTRDDVVELSTARRRRRVHEVRGGVAARRAHSRTVSVCTSTASVPVFSGLGVLAVRIFAACAFFPLSQLPVFTSSESSARGACEPPSARDPYPRGWGPVDVYPSRQDVFLRCIARTGLRLAGCLRFSSRDRVRVASLEETACACARVRVFSTSRVVYFAED